MKREWTPQQTDAIEARNGSILVSAAAGSGKTAVLVERVIRMITSPDHPVDADRLLVVTFTRDAAAEMKQRIAKALSDLLEKDPYNPQLLRQSKLIHTATICTIDSFCGDLVKEYFHTLDISSDYRIAEESELELMKAAALDSALEAFYNEDDQAFGKLLDAFSGKNGDLKLRETVLAVDGFLETQPFPEQWLDNMYKCYGERNVASSLWGKIIIDYANPAVSHAINLCENSLKILSEADEKLKNKQVPVIEDDLAYFQNLQKKLLGDSWDEMVNAVHAFAPKTLGTPKGYADDPHKMAAAANRNNVKETMKRLKTYFCRTEQQARDEFGELQELVGVLFDLTRRYIAELNQIKRRKNVLTFSDTELLAVRLLAEPTDDGGYRKTVQGNEISSRFDAVIVDEYQDVNDVQNLIFNCVSTDENNLFTVGDVKQCIYGFRQAKPQIFVGRKESYPRFDKNQPVYPATIILDKNFRSRQEICDTVNFIFSRLMNKETARMDYTRDEYLNVGAKYDQQQGCETELVMIEKGETDEEGAVLEARYMAQRIHEIMDSGFRVKDGDSTRTPTYGDFAVMLRTKSSAPLVVRTLSECGIPAYCEEKESAFETLEVKILLNFLRVIDNPALDIPLLSVLCSPVFGFTPDELAQIRANNRKTSLYSALRDYQKHSRKTADFLTQLAALRSVSYVSAVDDLIGRVLEISSLGAVTCALNGGEAPLQNLNMVRRYARDFEAGGGKNLSDFVFYIDRVLESGKKLPLSGGSDSSALNGVRVLSIHKSKGLEFPFCFLAGSGKRFNLRDLDEDILIDSNAGLGIRRKKGILRYDTLQRLAVRIEIERDELAEELRVLYVALTRPKEKLMIVSAFKNVDKYIQKTAGQLMFGHIIDPYTVVSARKELDWLTLCALANPSSRKEMLSGAEQITLREPYPTWVFCKLDSTDVLNEPEKTPEHEEQPREKLTDTDYAELLRENLAYSYPRAEATALPQKVSASQITHSQSGDYFEKIIVKPKFLSDDNSTAVERGTAHHLFLQYCDFAAARADIDSEISRLQNEGLLSDKQAELIDRKGLSGLLHTALFDRVIASNEIYREEQFTVKIPASLVFDDSDSDENIVMQGAVDLAFMENGKLVIVDYKTDRVRDLQKLVTLYQKQLSLYREAMRRSMECEVSECIICSVALNGCITV